MKRKILEYFFRQAMKKGLYVFAYGVNVNTGKQIVLNSIPNLEKPEFDIIVGEIKLQIKKVSEA